MDKSQHDLRIGKRLVLRGIAVVAALGVALICALWISNMTDPVRSRRFTYRDGTFDYFYGWEDEELVAAYPDGRAKHEVVRPIPVQIATHAWADLRIVYRAGNGSIYGVCGEASIVDRQGNCLWRCEFDGLDEDLFAPDSWSLLLADVDADGLVEAVTTVCENVEGETWTGERCLKTVAVTKRVERLDGKMTPVDAGSLSLWRRFRFGLPKQSDETRPAPPATPIP